MSLFLGLVTTLVLDRAAVSEGPALWMTPQGVVTVRGKAVPVRLTKGANAVETPFGLVIDCDGTHGGLLIPDVPSLALADKFTVATWVYLRAYVKEGPGAQILFQGDDRSGLDPYTLTIHGDGTVAFAINDAKNEADQVTESIPLKRWVRITASFDSNLCEMKLWLDDRCAKTLPATHQPLINLDKGSAPGIGIGNVQNDKGPHNQPFSGMIADLRLYDTVLKPAEAGYAPFKS